MIAIADVGDDGFGIKSGRDEEGRKLNRPTEDVTYLRLPCRPWPQRLRHRQRRVRRRPPCPFPRLHGDGTDNGIRLKSTRGRGGIVEDIVASNIRLQNVRNAIVLSLRYTKTPVEPFSERTPQFRDIHIDHVTADQLRKRAA